MSAPRAGAWRSTLLAEWLTITLLLCTLAAGGAGFNWLWRADRLLYDLSLALWRAPAPPDVLIVAIDDESIARLGRWPWSRALHARMLDRLGEAGARAVALDLILTEASAAEPAADAALAAALARNARAVLSLIMNTGGVGALREALPLPALATAAGGLGHIQLDLDEDGIARAVYLREGLGAPRWPHLALALLAAAGAPVSDPLPGARAPARAAPTSAWTRDHYYPVAYSGPPGHIASVPYVHVLEGRVPPERLRGQLVLVGMTASAAGDAYPVPTADEGRPMPGVEIVAQVLDNLRRGIDLRFAPAGAHAALSAFVVAALLTLYLRLTPRQALLATGAAILLVTAGAAAALRLGQYWVGPSAALFALAVCYPLWSWRRLEATQRFLEDELAQLVAAPVALPTPMQPPAPDERAIDPVARRIGAVRTAAARMKALQRFLEDINASLPDAQLVTDSEGTVLLANPAAQRLFERDAEGAPAPMRRSAAAMLAKLDFVRPPNWAELVDNAPCAYAARARDGRDLLVGVAPCIDEDERRIGMVIRVADITALRSAQREREELLRFLSHDMRAPQASILALAELQAGGDRTLPADQAWARVSDYARRTLKLADDFVQLARAESADTTAFGEVDLAAVAQEAADEIWPQAHTRQVQVQRLLGEEEHWVRGDRQLLMRALLNLLSNAVRHAPGGSTVSIGLDRVGGTVLCTVRDSGPGIDPGLQGRLFQRFERLGAAEQESAPGSGLGLAFVRTVAQRHGGRVAVYSAPGQGAAFSIALPAIPPPPE